MLSTVITELLVGLKLSIYDEKPKIYKGKTDWITFANQDPPVFPPSHTELLVGLKLDIYEEKPKIYKGKTDCITFANQDSPTFPPSHTERP